jgi:homoserine acetyltransferase
MLYLSKAMDMFDLSLPLTESTDADHIMSSQYHLNPPMPFVVDPEQSQQDLRRQLVHGISRIKCPSLIMGVDSDILFPLEQQVEVAECLREVGLDVTFKEVNSIYGHDTFLIDTDCIGQEIKRFLG